MRTKVTLVLLFLNVAVFFFIFKFEPGWRTEHAAQEARRRVLGAEAANIQSLEIASPGSTPAISLARRDSTWYLTKPFDWPANPLAVQRIVTDLLLLVGRQWFNREKAKKLNEALAAVKGRLVRIRQLALKPERLSSDAVLALCNEALDMLEPKPEADVVAPLPEEPS